MDFEQWKKTAASEEGRKWVYEAAELAKKEGLKICEIEDYDWGKIIRFAFPDNLEEEADVSISYKRVHWLGETEFCRTIAALFSTSDVDGKIQGILEELAYNSDLIKGYEFDGYFNEFIKKVETQEEAVAEVKTIIPRVKEAVQKLNKIKKEAKSFLHRIGSNDIEI